ncbi:sensor histidine kinase [Rubrivirga sp.]|uniref:sensor histidine kinase n=1 Tax=Rubrivirga sp. TaxID=1885344 RepID=UPI003B53021E
MITAADLRTIDVFSDQPEDDLAWLASVADEQRISTGAVPFQRGDPADTMFAVIEGGFQIFTIQGETRTLFGTIRAGEISGLLPFSRMETFAGEGVAISDGRIARVHRDHFPEMLSRMPEVGQRLVARMTDRVRESSKNDVQREKMMSLGKLSAGLAHELNNPAAAIRRSVADLRERLDQMPTLVTRLTGHGLTPDQVEAARGALMTCTAPTPGTLSTVERSEREDDLADWLDVHDVPHAYVVAEILAEEGVTPKALTHLAEHVDEAALSDVILWIEKGLASNRLLAEIERAAGRISDLVASVKGYTHRDQAPDRQRTDLHEGLDQTLTMLGHSVKVKSARVVRDYGTDVPPVSAFPGEINQVWTNLLDNALDAIGDGGEVRIGTRAEGAVVCVTIADDGPGIPADVQERIFEPFYTTKEPGKGTGLGLDIARRIVMQHQGRLSVESEPGRTVFEVCLPIDTPRASVTPLDAIGTAATG